MTGIWNESCTDSVIAFTCGKVPHPRSAVTTPKNAKIFASLEQAREAESFAYDEEYMTSVFEFSEALRIPEDKAMQLYSDLLEKAKELGLKNYY